MQTVHLAADPPPRYLGSTSSLKKDFFSQTRLSSQARHKRACLSTKTVSLSLLPIYRFLSLYRSLCMFKLSLASTAPNGWPNERRQSPDFERDQNLTNIFPLVGTHWRGILKSNPTEEQSGASASLHVISTRAMLCYLDVPLRICRLLLILPP